jgi:murein DD-endopeptidase MepM/ murein hydrolase activator NlpD
MFAAGAAALLSGCSDATRFSDPLADPFQDSAPRSVDRAPTGAISGSYSPGPYAEGPRRPIVSRPLPPAQQPMSSAPSAPIAAPGAVAPAPAPTRMAGAYNHWSAEGGTPIVVGEGESASVVANRYGVPVDALLRVNGFGRPAEVRPGSRLVIPVYRAGAVAAPTPVEARAPAAPAPAPVARQADLRDRARARVAEPRVEQKPERKVAEKIEPARPVILPAPAPVKQAAKEPEPAKSQPVKLQPKVAVAPKEKEPVKVAIVAKAKPAEPERKIAHAEERKPAAQPEQVRKLARMEPTPAPKAAPQPERKLARVEPEAARKPIQPEPARKIARAEPEPARKTQEAPQKLAKLEPARKAEPRVIPLFKEPAAEPKRAAAPEPEQKIAAAPSRSVDQTPTASIPAQEEKASASADARPEFRWPARGRIIQGFNAGGNDGINISVPEGTQVKAAEGGVVAYAGSELKGYGNLVLIRHPNGFVSAYAHNGEIDVKRGDQVKRGQTIAKSGQSGNVGSPQLHFELRKGATPVDPTGYLAGL